MLQLFVGYEVVTPAGAISPAGVTAIFNVITSENVRESEDWQKLNPTWKGRGLPALPTDWQWTWVVTGKGEYIGTFTKRVAKYYFKSYELKCPPSFLQKIGELARVHSGEATHYKFRFVDEFNWTPGDYGDSGSCYWGSNSEALNVLTDNAARAVLFEEPIRARAWVAENLPENDLIIVFNGYGFSGDSTLSIARILAHWKGVSYKRIELRNHNVDNGTLWINAGRGYIVGPAESLERWAEFDFQWGEPRSCENCGCGVNDGYWGVDECLYCEDCYYEIFDSCEWCSETYYHDDMYWVGDSRFCNHCFERQCFVCYRCGEPYRNSEAHEHEDGYAYCEACISEILAEMEDNEVDDE